MNRLMRADKQNRSISHYLSVLLIFVRPTVRLLGCTAKLNVLCIQRLHISIDILDLY